MKFLFSLILMTASAFAQHSEQPEKESTTDLRNTSLLFSIEDVSQNKTYLLEKTPSSSTFLRMTHKGQDSVRKIDVKEASKLDMDFASRFLKVQYEIADVPGDCQVTLRLNMKGEKQELCQKDDKKTQEIAGFVAELAKRF